MINLNPILQALERFGSMLPEDPLADQLHEALLERPEGVLSNSEALKNLHTLVERSTQTGPPVDNAQEALTMLADLLLAEPQQRATLLQGKAPSFTPSTRQDLAPDEVYDRLDALTRLIEDIEPISVPQKSRIKSFAKASLTSAVIPLIIVIAPLWLAVGIAGMGIILSATILGFVVMSPLWEPIIRFANQSLSYLKTRDAGGDSSWPELTLAYKEHPYPRRLRWQLSNRRPISEHWLNHKAVARRVHAVMNELRLRLNPHIDSMMADYAKHTTQDLRPFLLPPLDAILRDIELFKRSSKNDSRLMDLFRIDRVQTLAGLLKKIISYQAITENDPAWHYKYMSAILTNMRSLLNNKEYPKNSYALLQAVESLSRRFTPPAPIRRTKRVMSLNTIDLKPINIGESLQEANAFVKHLLNRLGVTNRDMDVLMGHWEKNLINGRRTYIPADRSANFRNRLAQALKALQTNVHVLLEPGATAHERLAARSRILNIVCEPDQLEGFYEPSSSPFLTPEGNFWYFRYDAEDDQFPVTVPKDGIFHYAIRTYFRDETERTHFQELLDEFPRKQKPFVNILLGFIRNEKISMSEEKRFHQELPDAMKAVRWQIAERYGVSRNRIKLRPATLLPSNVVSLVFKK